MIARDPRECQALHGARRVRPQLLRRGLGMFFQKTIKEPVLEKLLDTAWQGVPEISVRREQRRHTGRRRNPGMPFFFLRRPFLALPQPRDEAEHPREPHRQRCREEATAHAAGDRRCPALAGLQVRMSTTGRG